MMNSVSLVRYIIPGRPSLPGTPQVDFGSGELLLLIMGGILITILVIVLGVAALEKFGNRGK